MYNDIIYNYCDNLLKYKEDDVILFIQKFKENELDSTLKSILGLLTFKKNNLI